MQVRGRGAGQEKIGRQGCGKREASGGTGAGCRGVGASGERGHWLVQDSFERACACSWHAAHLLQSGAVLCCYHERLVSVSWPHVGVPLHRQQGARRCNPVPGTPNLCREAQKHLCIRCMQRSGRESLRCRYFGRNVLKVRIGTRVAGEWGGRLD